MWTIVVTGNGRAFCTGADVGEIPDDGRVIYEEPYLSTFAQWEAPQEATPPFRTMTKPIITAVNGICCGAGLDLVTTGDIAIASDQADVLRPPREHRPGVGPRDGAPRPGAAHERRHADRAHRPARADERAAGLRARADHRGRRARPPRSSGPTRSPRWSTATPRSPCAAPGSAIRKGLDLPLHEAEILAEAFRERVVRTDDAKEGPLAFMEKREPEWTGT